MKEETHFPFSSAGIIQIRFEGLISAPVPMYYIGIGGTPLTEKQ